jgi:hypothetical protein
VHENLPGDVEPSLQVRVDEPVSVTVRDQHSDCNSGLSSNCLGSEVQSHNFISDQSVRIDSEQPLLVSVVTSMADAAAEVGQSVLAGNQQAKMASASVTPKDAMIAGGLTTDKKPLQSGDSSPLLTNRTVNKLSVVPSSPAVASTKKTDFIVSFPHENTPDRAKKSCNSADKIETRTSGVILPAAARPVAESCCLQVLRLSCDEDSSALLSDCSDPLDQLGQAITSSGGSDQQQTVCVSVAFDLLRTCT